MYIMIVGLLCVSNAQNSWQPISNFPSVARSWPASFTIGEKAYVGTGGQSFIYNNDLWEYDTVTGIWTQKANVGGPLRGGAAGFSINGKGYMGLGRNSTQLYYDLWEYDPILNTWSFNSFFPGSNVDKSATFVVQNKAYVVAGGTATNIGTESNNLWEFNPSGNTWSQKTSIPSTGRNRAVGFEIFDKGYIACGYGFDSSTSSSQSTNEVWEYDAILDTWTQKANYPGSGRSDCAGFSIGNYGYVGMGRFMYTTEFWRFDPLNDSWTQVDQFIGSGRIAGVSFSTTDKGFVGLGYTVTTQLIEFTDFYQFQDQTLSEQSINATNNISIYPNPFDNELIIETSSFKNAAVYNLSGKLLGLFQSETIDLSHLNLGVYILKVERENLPLIVKKIIKR
ncbi:putative exported protein [Nonlabens dokdonensis DSW-6]|uniref:Putative exported protein n=1 Tax=Nonlabens dokdonensis (strain DSM 17205 / KCTC 12402 / DSW-6) TaxID=592029 RepID=L7W5U0_NONDD|nr:putative exported protein [Nonlabens dokdonensis DSW-6]